MESLPKPRLELCPAPLEHDEDELSCSIESVLDEDETLTTSCCADIYKDDIEAFVSFDDSHIAAAAESQKSKKGGQQVFLCSQKTAATIAAMALFVVIGGFGIIQTLSVRAPQNEIIAGSEEGKRSDIDGVDSEEEEDGMISTWMLQPVGGEGESDEIINGEMYGWFDDDGADSEQQDMPWIDTNNMPLVLPTVDEKETIDDATAETLSAPPPAPAAAAAAAPAATKPTTSSSRKCGSNQGLVIFSLLTDSYSFETSFSITNLSNKDVVLSGPPPNTRYDKNQRYIGSKCLDTGEYEFILKDLMKDGICCDYGEGNVSIRVNGKKVVNHEGEIKFDEKTYTFMVESEDSGEIAGTTPIVEPVAEQVGYPEVNNGKECSVVRPVNYNKKFQVGQGYETITTATNNNPQPINFQCYRTVKGTDDTVNDLLATYPNLVEKKFLGTQTTTENRRLYALVITNRNTNLNADGRVKPSMLMISELHAREMTTAETTLRFAEYLVQNYNKDPDVTWILDFTRIHIVFHANPDGRAYIENGGAQPMWKKNLNNSPKCDTETWRFGVDINRNFPFKWGVCGAVGSKTCSGSQVCDSQVYRGQSPQSEVETKAIVDYASTLFPVSQRKGSIQTSESMYNTPFPETSEGVFLDIHSFGRYIGIPWGWKDENTPNNAGLGALGRKLASFNRYRLWAPEMPNRIYGFDGGSVDTMYGWLGAASYFVELGTDFYEPCDTFPLVINEVFPAFLYAAKVSMLPYKTSRGPDVLCTTITSTDTEGGQYITAQIDVSDAARTYHDDDDASLFSTGGQSIKHIEVFVNCHPYSGSSCQPTRRKEVNAGQSTTATIRFRAPQGSNNVMYIRARDSGGFDGPVTARIF